MQLNNVVVELAYDMWTVSIPQAVSTVASSPLFSPSFGQGLEMCGPHRRFAPLLSRTLRRIPQAVGTVATFRTTVSDIED